MWLVVYTHGQTDTDAVNTPLPYGGGAHTNQIMQGKTQSKPALQACVLKLVTIATIAKQISDTDPLCTHMSIPVLKIW